MFQQELVARKEGEHDLNKTEHRNITSRDLLRLVYRKNPGVGGLCASCVRFPDCTYPKSARGSWFCDEYSR